MAVVALVVLLAVAFVQGEQAKASTVCPPGNNDPAYCVSKPDVCIYVDSPVLGLTSGHVFLQLLPDRGPQKGKRNLVYGFAPKSSWGFLGGAGEVSSNGTHGWDYKICYPVEVAKYNNIARSIRQSTARPPEYDLLTSNCVEWTANRVATAGIRMPPSLNRVGIPDPNALEITLERIGVGNKYRGGTVYKNTKGVTPEDAADPPTKELDASSYIGIASFALLEPSRLASGLRLRKRDLHPRKRTMGRRHALRIRLSHTDRAVIAIDWGDGSQTMQHRRASHKYRRPGRYRVRVAVVNDTTVFRMVFLERVRRRGPSDVINKRVPRTQHLPSFPPGPKAPAPAALG